MTISQAVRRYREDKGYCQEYMADQLKISQATYSRLEKSNDNCIKRLIDIAKALDTLPDTLLTYTSGYNKGLNVATIEPTAQPEMMLLDKDEIIQHQAKEITFLRDQVSHLQSIWHHYCRGVRSDL